MPRHSKRSKAKSAPKSKPAKRHSKSAAYTEQRVAFDDQEAANETPDEMLDFSDIPETDAEFWAHAKIVMPKDPRTAISIRLKRSTLDFFKAAAAAEDGRYQTHINRVLDGYVAARRRALQRD